MQVVRIPVIVDRVSRPAQVQPVVSTCETIVTLALAWLGRDRKWIQEVEASTQTIMEPVLRVKLAQAKSSTRLCRARHDWQITGPPWQT